MSRYSKTKKRRKKQYNPLKQLQKASGHGTEKAANFSRFLEKLTEFDIEKIRKRHLEEISRELELSAIEIFEEYKKDKMEEVSSKSRDELLSCEDWLLTTEYDEICYGKLDSFLESFELTHRKEECLVNGFINFDEILSEEGYLITSKSIEYNSSINKTMTNYFG